jgi:hypothetical protein
VKPTVLLAMMGLRGVEAVAQAILRHADVEFVTVDPATELLERWGIASRGLDTFLPPEPRAAAVPHALERITQTLHALERPEWQAAYPELPPGWWSAASDGLAETLRTSVISSMLRIDALRFCAAQTDLRCLVVSDDVRPDMRAMVTAAARFGIPSLQVIHAMPLATPVPWRPVSTTRTAVYSDHAGDLCAALGAPAESLAVTGNPGWDEVAHPPRPGARVQACRDMGLDPDRPIVTYAATGAQPWTELWATYPDHHVRLARHVFDAFVSLSARHTDWQFVLRPRPGPEQGTFFDGLLAELPEALRGQFSLDRTPPLVSTMVADVYVCTESGIGIEAMLSDTPVVNVALDDCGDEVYHEGLGPLFDDEDAVLQARTPESIGVLVEAAMTDNDTRAALERRRPRSIARFNGPNDGRAAERVAALVVEMVGEGPSMLPPVRHFPELEWALADLVPREARSVLVVGRAASAVAEVIREERPETKCRDVLEFGGEVFAPVDAVVFSDPMPHDATAEASLRSAVECLVSGGICVAGFLNGAGPDGEAAHSLGAWVPPRAGMDMPLTAAQYSRRGVSIVLSRLNLAEASVREIFRPEQRPAWEEETGTERGMPPEAWVVCAIPRALTPGPVSAAEAEREHQGAELNRVGEERYGRGELREAEALFRKAVEVAPHSALFRNNLGAVLCAQGQPEHAYEAFLEALHLDPCFQQARDNLRDLAPELGRGDEAERLLRLYGRDA